jgi:hypothetical protein
MRKKFIFKVEITNWGKYQVRKDLKSMNFFRVQSNIFSDAKFIQLSQQAKLIWFYALSECASSNSNVIPIYSDVVSLLCQVKPSFVEKRILELEYFQLLKIVFRDESVPREERKEKRRENISCSIELKKFKLNETDIENIYKIYPRKQGKQQGFKSLKRQLKTQDQVEHFRRAVEKFCEVMAKENRQPEYIPIFSTFVNSQWLDYLEEDVGKVQVHDNEIIQKQRKAEFDAVWGET